MVESRTIGFQGLTILTVTVTSVHVCVLQVLVPCKMPGNSTRNTHFEERLWQQPLLNQILRPHLTFVMKCQVSQVFRSLHVFNRSKHQFLNINLNSWAVDTEHPQQKDVHPGGTPGNDPHCMCMLVYGGYRHPSHNGNICKSIPIAIKNMTPQGIEDHPLDKTTRPKKFDNGSFFTTSDAYRGWKNFCTSW